MTILSPIDRRCPRCPGDDLVGHVEFCPVCGHPTVGVFTVEWTLLNVYGDEVGTSEGDNAAEATRNAEADGWVVVYSPDTHTLVVRPDR